MMFGDFDVYECVLEVDTDGRTQSSRICAPRPVIETQFLHWVEQASHSSTPVKVGLYRMIPIYDQVSKRWIENRIGVSFCNFAYLSIHTEGGSYV